MIVKEYEKFLLYCDVCEEAEEQKFDQFYDAVDFAVKNDWGRKREQNEWLNVCPDCKEGSK